MRCRPAASLGLQPRQVYSAVFRHEVDPLGRKENLPEPSSLLPRVGFGLGRPQVKKPRCSGQGSNSGPFGLPCHHAFNVRTARQPCSSSSLPPAAAGAPLAPLASPGGSRRRAASLACSGADSHDLGPRATAVGSHFRGDPKCEEGGGTERHRLGVEVVYFL